MELPDADIVLVRHGDIGVKSGPVQGRMESQLKANLSAMIAARGLTGEVVREWSRLFIHTDEPKAASRAAADTFGVVSVSPARCVTPTMPAIEDGLVTLAREVYEDGSFAVRARRAGGDDEFEFDSMDIQRKGGGAIEDQLSHFETTVDLDNPDITFYVECREETAYLYCEKIQGPGGLPIGVQQPVVALISGGYDSPVAAWEIMRRGCPIIPVYFDFEDYGGVDHRLRMREAVKQLASYAPNFEFDIRHVPAGSVAETLIETTTATRMLSLRRFMFMAGEMIANETGAKGIVTGEAIGQKSSQTPANLAVTSQVTDCPIFRPLLCWDKHDIIEKAKAIGTYNEASIKAGCNRIAPSHPETNATIDNVEALEPDDLRDRASKAVQESKRISSEETTLRVQL